MLFRLVVVVSRFVVVWLGVLLVFWLWPEVVAAQEVSDGLVTDTNSEEEEVLGEALGQRVSGDELLDMFAESYALEFSVSPS